MKIKYLPFTYITDTRQTTIRSSFYQAMAQVDTPAPLIRELIRLYSWDVNWQRDLHRGDEVSVLFNLPQTPDGQIVESRPQVLHASLTLNGEPTDIFRFERDDGSVDYFKPDGTSIRRSLLRTPIDGARLSSSFSPRRLHPVYNRFLPHNGTDFAAPVGTPIYAAGDGTITFRGREPADGKLIRIEHGNGYVTGYSHLNGFAPNINLNDRVNQGDVIGYVGMTGSATGPHLHYSVKKDGEFLDPMTIDLPQNARLEGDELLRFYQERDNLRLQVQGPELANLQP